MTPVSVLCPVDFSDASGAALNYAAALADHFQARLTVLTVDDPILESAAVMAHLVPSMATETDRELHRFVEAQLPPTYDRARIDVRRAVGSPAPEILKAAAEHHADLIVMSSHGRSGLSKRFFGSTTERVLRTTTVPVLITPGERPAGQTLTAMAQGLGLILAPVDLTAASAHQISVAAGLSRSLALPLLLGHVLEPVFAPPSAAHVIPGLEAERVTSAQDRLKKVAAAAGDAGGLVETIVVSGDPSGEIASLAQARGARLIVMGLHSTGLLGPRMGSVTYRVLCQVHALVLALPPAAV